MAPALLYLLEASDL